MRRFVLILISTSILSVITACSGEDPQPELRDKVFEDLSKKAKAFEGEQKSTEAEVEGLKVSLGKAEPNSIEGRDIQKNLLKAQRKLIKASELAKYYKIRAERRRLEARIEYRKAFKEGKGDEWPNAKTFEGYETMNRLREANLNWNKRVPKLADRLHQRKPTSSSSSKPKQGH